MQTRMTDVVVSVALLILVATTLVAQELPTEHTIGTLQVVAMLNGAMPTGVTVANSGRMFVCFPKWTGDTVEYTVAELKNGKTYAYPDAEINRYKQGDNPADKLVSVQSVVVDSSGERLWILDTGNFEDKLMPGGAKLIAVDLSADRIVKRIVLPPAVALPDVGINDVRFDLHRGKEGTAFITDAGGNSLIVVDLASEKSWRRLVNHVSTSPDPKFVPIVEGEVFPRQPGPPEMIAVGADGIAISPDGKTLYYCPAISRHLYSLNLDVLADPGKSDADVAATVKDLGEKGGGSDGLESDAEGRVYLSNYEHHAIHRRLSTGEIETVVYDPRVLFPDTLSLASDGFLYFTSNQVGRIAGFNNGHDHRQKPYAIFRVKVDGTRIR